MALGALLAIFGALFALSTPPVDFVPCVWLGLAGLAFACSVEPKAAGRRAWREVAGRGLAFGFGVSFVAHRFVPDVVARFTPLPWAAGLVALALLALSQGLPFAALALVHRGLAWNARGPWRRALAFAIGAYVAAFVPAIFPWTPAGCVTAWPALLQLADVIGERGVAALLALSAGLLAESARSAITPGARRHAVLPALLGVVLPVAMSAHGVWRMHQVDAIRAQALTTQVALVDPTIAATVRWDPAAAPGIVDLLGTLTASAEARGAGVTVWPESAFPYVLAHGAPYDPRIFRRGARGPLLVGAITQDARGERYNSVLGASSGGTLTPSYDKLHLLWFGEQVPLAGAFPWLRRTFARGVGLVPGDHPVRIDVGAVKAGVLICFEDILPAAGREAASLAPNLLVDVSNDAWFVGSAESELHLRLSVLRAIETRRDLVRAVNFGPSSHVDAAGRVLARFDPPVPGSLLVEPALLEGPPTFYARFGDLPFSLVIAAAALALAGWARLSRGRSSPPTA